MKPAFLDWPTPEAATTLAYWQDGRCAMCGSTGRLVMDHDHRTHLVRGLLCRSCNGTEPHSSSPEWEAWRAGDHAAARLGVVEEYSYIFPGHRIMYDELNREPTDEEIAAIANAVAEGGDKGEAAVEAMIRAHDEQKRAQRRRRSVSS